MGRLPFSVFRHLPRIVQAPAARFWGANKTLRCSMELHLKSAEEIARLIRERDISAVKTLEPT
jgi:hypothetical protein